MDARRTEGSLLASLCELRAIEHQRVADERAAVEAAAQARRDEQDTRERLAREAEMARLAAERDAQLAVEQARADAEREARLRLEAAHAAEKARQQIALDHRRLLEDTALRREVARRQRPRWMLAVTACAVAAAIGLGGFALHSYQTSQDAALALDRALEARRQAIEAMYQMQVEIDQLARELASVHDQIAAALDAVKAAQDDIDRRAAHARLVRLQRYQSELEDQRRRREQERAHQQRIRGIDISDDCLRDVICRQGKR